MRFNNTSKKETRAFKDVLIILTSVSIFMLATVLESCSYETVDVFSSSQDNDSVPVSNDNMPSPKTRRTKTTTATIASSPSTSTVRSWPSHEFFENILGKSGPPATHTTTTSTTTTTTTPPPLLPEYAFTNIIKGSVTRINNGTTVLTNYTKLTKPHKEDQFNNNSVVITTRGRPMPIVHENYTNTDNATIRPFNTNVTDSDERTRSQLSREWKLGFDISIVEAENASKTNHKEFDTEALYSRDDVSRAPSSVVTNAEIPLTIRRDSIRKRTPASPTSNNQTETQGSNLYAKVSGSHNFGQDGKTVWEIRNKTTTYKIKKMPQADYVDDENTNPYGWIDEIGDFTSAPLDSTPKFPSVTWPYTTKKSESKTTVFPFSIYRPKSNTTRRITPRPKVIQKTSTSTDIDSTKPFTSRSESKTTTWTQIPVLIVENEQPGKLTSQHWGIEETEPLTLTQPAQKVTSKPLRVKTTIRTPTTRLKLITAIPTTPSTTTKATTTTTKATTTTTTATTTEFNEEENDPPYDFVESLLSVVSEKPEISEVITTRAPTNIWYKPIINHYSYTNVSTTTTTPIITTTTTEQYNDTNSNLSYENMQEQPYEKSEEVPEPMHINFVPISTAAPTPVPVKSTLPTPTKSNLKYKIKTANSKEKVIIFKIWNYLNGKLELQAQREIPSWILKNFDIKDGDVLNLQQLPPQIKDLVKNTVQNGREEAKENRTEREQFHWQELPSVSPDLESGVGVGVGSDGGDVDVISSEKTRPNFPAWITDGSTEWKRPVSLNYVVLNSTRVPAYILNHGSSSEETHSNYQQYLQEYLQYLTTSAPPTIKAPGGESVPYWTKIKNQQNLNRLQQLLLDFMATTPTPIVKDSHPWDKIKDEEFMANLASFAIIMTHLKGQYPNQQAFPSFKPESTTPNPYGFTPPARDHFWASMYPLLQHLLNNRNFTYIPPATAQSIKNPYPASYNNFPTLPPFHSLSVTEATRYNVDQLLTSTPLSNKDNDNDSDDDDDDSNANESNNNSEDSEEVVLNEEFLKGDLEAINDQLPNINLNDTNTRRVLAAAAGIAAIKAIKAIKKKKKKRDPWKFFNPSKLGLIKPGSYGFQFDVFSGGLVDIIKKKIGALVASIYMPVALVLAFGLLPLGVIFIPFLFKYLKLKLAVKGKGRKKRPVYVPVPYYVPYPAPAPAYPVYPSTQPHYHHGHGHGWPSDAYGTLDNYYAGDNTGYNNDGAEQQGDNEQIHHNYPEQGDGEDWPVDTESQSPSTNPQFPYGYNNENYDDNVGAQTYELGYEVGSKLGKLKLALPSFPLIPNIPIPEMGNEHDTEVLKILINNKKDMINRLLRKWRLNKAQSSPYVPSFDDRDSIDNENEERPRRRRK